MPSKLKFNRVMERLWQLFLLLHCAYVSTDIITRFFCAESVAILAAFLGPSKAIPLIRAIELLENHFEKGRFSITKLSKALHNFLCSISKLIPCNKSSMFTMEKSSRFTMEIICKHLV
jgi:hypothetical protein